MVLSTRENNTRVHKVSFLDPTTTVASFPVSYSGDRDSQHAQKQDLVEPHWHGAVVS